MKTIKLYLYLDVHKDSKTIAIAIAEAQRHGDRLEKSGAGW